MKLEISLTKEKYDALEESLKQFYVANQEGGFELDGVGSIQRAFEAEKAKKATKPELLTELETLRKFKADQETAASQAASEDLVAKGKYEDALKTQTAAWDTRFTAEKAERDSLLADIKRERLTNELVKRGALADRAGYLVGELDAETELAKGDDGKYTLKKKGGIGDAPEFDSLIEAAKTKSPFFFAANNASGSGASGGNNGGGAAMKKQATKAEVAGMDAATKRDFYLNDGEVTDG